MKMEYLGIARHFEHGHRTGISAAQEAPYSESVRCLSPIQSTVRREEALYALRTFGYDMYLA